MQPDVLIHSLRIQVDPADSTYMPSLIVVSGGENLSVLKEISTINLSPTDRVVTLVSNVKEFYRSEFSLFRSKLSFFRFLTPFPYIELTSVFFLHR